MKLHESIQKRFLYICSVSLLLSLNALGQVPESGSWEGIFMENFRLVIHLNLYEENSYEGRIFMYNTTQLIQDDPIQNITINGHLLSFLIKAKESSFEGSFNEGYTELSGNFIFPDQSTHPVKVRWIPVDSSNTVGNQISKVDIIEKCYSPGELREDLNFLVEKLVQYHPQLYRYTDEMQHRQIITKAYSMLDQPLNLMEFLHAISPVCDAVHCSHTGIRAPEEFHRAAMLSGNYFPLKVFASEDGLYLLEQSKAPDQGIEAGTPIKSINGISWEEILDDLLAFVPAEGFCQTTKYNALNHEFHSLYQLLDNAELFNLVLKTKQGDKEVSVKAVPYKQIASPSYSPSELPVNFTLKPVESLAILKIASFQIMNMEGYLSLLDSLFQKLRNENIEHLVVDLRDNQGGHPIFAAQLLSYLTSGEFTYFQRLEGIEEFEPLYGPMNANDHAFEGEILVLVNGACLSTTGHLISLLDYYTESVFVGEQPGSTYRCSDYSIQFRLPNTGIEVNIPRVVFETAVPDSLKKEIFIPDFLVEADPVLIANNVDPFMERVSRLLQIQSIK